MWKCFCLVSLTLFLIGAATQPSEAAKRVALVVGNDQYISLPKLQKAVNDARAVGAALKVLGFEVIGGEDLSRRDMNRKLADLEKAIAPADTVFFFFAGHGVAIGADNLLLATDMPSPQQGEEGLVREEGVAVDSVVRRLQTRGAETTLLVLDACRDNPFEASGTRNIGLSRGLAKLDAPTGVFVLFSAGIGQTALDRLPNDSDPNSVFTRKLVPILKTAGLSHVGIAKRVQKEVGALAASINHRQQPAYYDQIDGEIFLNGAVAEPAVKPDVVKSTQAATRWAKLAETADEAALAAFATEFSDTPFGSLAQLRIQELRKQAALGQAAKSAEERAKKAEEELAEQKEQLAALEASTKADPSDSSIENPVASQALVRTLQTELVRVGCLSGVVDGKWGGASKRALELFNEHGRAALPTDAPSEEAVTAAKALSGRVCPLICTKGTEGRDGECVAVQGSSISELEKKRKKESKVDTKKVRVKKIVPKNLTSSSAISQAEFSNKAVQKSVSKKRCFHKGAGCADFDRRCDSRGWWGPC